MVGVIWKMQNSEGESLIYYYILKPNGCEELSAGREETSIHFQQKSIKKEKMRKTFFSFDQTWGTTGFPPTISGKSGPATSPLISASSIRRSTLPASGVPTALEPSSDSSCPAFSSSSLSFSSPPSPFISCSAASICRALFPRSSYVLQF